MASRRGVVARFTTRNQASATFTISPTQVSVAAGATDQRWEAAAQMRNAPRASPRPSSQISGSRRPTCSRSRSPSAPKLRDSASRSGTTAGIHSAGAA